MTKPKTSFEEMMGAELTDKISMLKQNCSKHTSVFNSMNYVLVCVDGKTILIPHSRMAISAKKGGFPFLDSNKFSHSKNNARLLRPLSVTRPTLISVCKNDIVRNAELTEDLLRIPKELSISLDNSKNLIEPFPEHPFLRKFLEPG
jgi:hypothetical protein